MEHSSTIGLSNDQAAEESIRHRLFGILETAKGNDFASRAVDVGLFIVISLSVIAVVLESVASLESRYSAAFLWFEVFTVAVFTFEYALRVWSSVESTPGGVSGLNALWHRLRYMISAYALIDLVAFLPFYLLAFGLLGDVDMRFLRAVRLLRVLKLTRYSRAFDLLITTFNENISALAASFFILLTVILLAATGMYYFERESQPIAFGSIPAAMWWSFSTLTTVGYGDVTPITATGKVFGALITVVGIGMVALPTGILASGYAQQLKMRSDEYKSVADKALDDGILTADEDAELERLRVDLGLGKHTASQILEAERVRLELRKQGSSSNCPHCGKAIVYQPVDEMP